jgi:uncharacterized RDD family membrane protein YckC
MIIRRIFAAIMDYVPVIIFTQLFVNRFAVMDNGVESVPGILGVIPFLFWFVFIVLTEFFFTRTFGNFIMGLKPVTVVGDLKPTLKQSFKRHILDCIDLVPGIVAIICIISTPKKQRLGDIFAGSYIVKTPSGLL